MRCSTRDREPLYGLRRGAFRPEDEVGVWRSSLRQRRRLVAMASRAVQHRQKAREQMHLKLTEVVSEASITALATFGHSA